MEAIGRCVIEFFFIRYRGGNLCCADSSYHEKVRTGNQADSDNYDTRAMGVGGERRDIAIKHHH